MFKMTVSDVFNITGRGTVVTGRVEMGQVSVGDRVDVAGTSYVVNALEMFRKSVNVASEGDMIGIVLDAKRNMIERGMVITKGQTGILF